MHFKTSCRVGGVVAIEAFTLLLPGGLGTPAQIRCCYQNARSSNSLSGCVYLRVWVFPSTMGGTYLGLHYQNVVSMPRLISENARTPKPMMCSDLKF